MEFGQPFKLEPPIDFGQTLERLAEWEGRQVHVGAWALPAPGQPQTHTQLTATGVLGPVIMVDNAIDPDADSVAAFPIGTHDNTGIYLSRDSFKSSMPLGDGSLRIDFADSFSIQVRVTD